jgi:hypothetical protein
MNLLLLTLVKIFHTIIVLFIVVTPFLNYKPLLFLHVLFVPMMLLHWAFNDDTCSLTILEEGLTKKLKGSNNYKEEDCVTCKMIKPVYKFINNKDEFSGLIWLITLILSLFAIFKMYYYIYYNKIRHPLDLVLF